MIRFMRRLVAATINALNESAGCEVWRVTR